MPHVVIKLMSGRSEPQKRKLAELVTKAVMEGAGCGEESVSVAIEDVATGKWSKEVYNSEIKPNLELLYKKPGYTA
jgi:4-oxalocrotonate tautomerase